MFRKIYSHLWIVAIVLFIITSIAECGIVEVFKVLMVIGIGFVFGSSIMVWLWNLHDKKNDNEISGYQPKRR